MERINWFWVAAGIFLVGCVMSYISTFVTGAAWYVFWISGALLNLAGWTTYVIGWINR